jgi:uncharacterized protein (DUF2267 family)
MQYDEFLIRVQRYADLDSLEEAERITYVVLSTLGEPLYRTARDKLVAQLPKELKDVPFQSQPAETAPSENDRYPVEEFYKRVRARAEVSPTIAQQQAKAVMRVVAEAVSPGAIQDMLQELPDDYRQLFEAEV